MLYNCIQYGEYQLTSLYCMHKILSSSKLMAFKHLSAGKMLQRKMNNEVFFFILIFFISFCVSLIDVKWNKM